MSDYLYHYTSQKNLDNILSSREIWFTNLNDFNDKLEKQYFKRIYHRVILIAKRSNPNSIFIQSLPDHIDYENNQKHFINFSRSKFQEANMHYYEKLSIESACDYYILCFSKQRNNKYLHKNYGKSSNNLLSMNMSLFYEDLYSYIGMIYSSSKIHFKSKNSSLLELGKDITFSRSDFHYNSNLSFGPFLWGDVTYERKKQSKNLLKLISMYEDKYNKSINLVNISDLVKTLLYDLEIYSLMYKKRYPFKKEKEFRVVIPIANFVKEEIIINNGMKKLVFPIKNFEVVKW
jgi:hypothetical protein